MDIRMVRGRNSRVWAWVISLAVAAVLLWAGSTFVFGDPTQQAGRAVGADANFGGERAPVQPVEVEPFEDILPLEPRELGRLVRLRGVAESRLRDGTIWVRAGGNRRILVRFQPLPEAGPPALGPGFNVDVEGYVQRMSRAEFAMWMDSLGIALPRPRPGDKFGDLPDTLFARVDTLFIRDYYVSVRPWGLQPGRDGPRVEGAEPARPETPGEEETDGS